MKVDEGIVFDLINDIAWLREGEKKTERKRLLDKCETLILTYVICLQSEALKKP